MKRVLFLLLGLLIGATAHAQFSPQASSPHTPDGITTSRNPITELGSDAPAPLSAEAWLPMGQGLKTSYAPYSTIMNGDLYVLHVRESFRDNLIQIAKWNGSSWDSIAAFISYGKVYAFAAYRGELYVGGYFEEVEGIPGSQGIIRWNGNSWQSVGGGLDAGAAYSLMEWRGELYVTGNFGAAGSTTGTSGIARWDGTRWADVGGGLPTRSLEGIILDMALFRGKLYITGWFTEIGGVQASYVAAWNGNKWEALPVTPNREGRVLAVYKNELYLYGPYVLNCGGVNTPQLARWDGRQWRGVGEHGLWTSIQELMEFNGKLYAAATDAGNGIARWDGTTWDPVATFDGPPRFLIRYDDLLVTGGHFTSLAGTPLNQVARMCSDGECGTISGSVFVDKNKDCTRSPADSMLRNRTVMFQPGPIYVSTDVNGRFAQKVLPGTYTLTLLPRQYWAQTCPLPVPTHSVTLTSGNQQRPNNDFASQPIPNVEDVRISITTSRARAGQEIDYIITYENFGTVPVNGSVTFTYDPRLTHAHSAPSSHSTGPSSLIWQFTDLAVDESRTIRTSLNVPTSMQAGTTLCGNVNVETEHEPVLMAYHDDRDSACVDVTASFDPNDITVHPFERDGDTGLGPADSVLTYTVRFQNTGNDTAFKVVIVDSLSPHLDPASLRLGAASHAYTFAISGNGVLTWTFDDIMLPDSGASEPNSHGVLKYFVRLRDHLPGGTKIPNRAAIYFDYNAPVATNTVISTVAAVLGVDDVAEGTAALLMPNPSTGVMHINAQLRHGTEVIVTDVLGTVLMRRRVEGLSAGTLDLAGLPAGTYFVALPLQSGTVMKMVRLAR